MKQNLLISAFLVLTSQLSFAQEDVIWTNPQGVIIDGNTVKNISNYAAGAFSLNSLLPDEDGWVEITIIDKYTENIHIGLSAVDVDETHRSIKYGLSIGTSVIYSNNLGTRISYDKHAIGDRLRVEKSGNQILLKRNDVTFHIFEITEAEELFIECSLNSFGRYLVAKASFGANDISDEHPLSCSISGTPLEWTNEANVEVSSGTIAKVSGVDGEWDAGASSTTSLSSGKDGWVEFEVLESNKGFTIGFTETDSDLNFNTIKYQMRLGRSGTLYLSDDYYTTKVIVGSYDGGDLIKIERLGDYIFFSQNGDLIYASNSGNNESLLFDISLVDIGAGLTNIESSFGVGSDISLGSNLITNNNWISGDCDTEGIFISNEGNVGINTSDIPPEYDLAVDGKAIMEEVKVQYSENWPDYVFAEGHNLKSLNEVEEFITERHHLPEIPSESEVAKNGINLGEMDAKLLQKIEELTLYLIDQNKKLELATEEIQNLKLEIEELKNQ